eukprot:403365982
MNQGECQICKDSTKPSKYRCPNCFVKYCSLDCFKLHKNDQDSEIFCDTLKKLKQQPQQKQQPQLNTEQRPLEVQDQQNEQYREQQYSQQNQAQNQQYQIRDLVLNDDDIVVPDFKIQQALQNEKLKSFLSHSKLKEVIRDIDSSKNRMKRLHSQMVNDPPFMEFLDVLLNELGYIDENGQFDAYRNSDATIKPKINLPQLELQPDE